MHVRTATTTMLNTCSTKGPVTTVKQIPPDAPLFMFNFKFALNTSFEFTCYIRTSTLKIESHEFWCETQNSSF